MDAISGKIRLHGTIIAYVYTGAPLYRWLYVLYQGGWVLGARKGETGGAKIGFMTVTD